MLKAAIIAALLLAGLTPAHAEPISAAIGLTSLIAGFGASAAVAGTIGSVIVGVGASLALNFASSLFRPKQTAPTFTDSQASSPTGVQTSVTAGGAVPRGAIFGIQATAGQLVYWNTFGDDNKFLELVFAIGDGAHDSLHAVYASGVKMTFGTPDSIGTPLVELNNGSDAAAWFRFHNGAEDQSVDDQLVSNANPFGRWTANDALSGICYIVITLNYNEVSFPSGRPNFLFEVKGLKQYDLRKDSSIGGDGAHRWGEPETYEWSDNPAICLYNYQRGVYLGGEIVLGQGLAIFDFINDMYIGAANACDEAVALKIGGTEPRYTCGLQASADNQHSAAIESFLTAMGGALLESAGAFGPIAGVGATSLYSFTDGDILAGTETIYSAKRSRADLINSIFGTYSEPSQNWQSVAFAPRVSAADELVDGERLAVQRDYSMVYSQTQAQRLAEIERRLSRFQATGTVTLGLKAAVVEPGDWVTWTSARYDFTKIFQVVDSTGDQASVALSLREIDDGVFTWNNEVDELDPLVPGDVPGVGSLITTVPGLVLDGVTLNGADGVKQPSLNCLWGTITDRTVDAVKIEYRIATDDDSGSVKQIRFDNPFGGSGLIIEGIQASTDYEARATIETTPIRVTAWTEWVPETSPSEHVVKAALSSVEVRIASLAAELRDLVTNQFAAANDARNKTEQLIASNATEQEAANELEGNETRLTQTIQFGSVHASITQVSESLETTNLAFASYQVTVNASLGDLNASITETSEAIATIDGNLAASYTMTVDADGIIAQIKAYSDGTTSGLNFRADLIQFSIPGETGGEAVNVFQIGTVNGTPGLVWRGDMYGDGTFHARAIIAGTVNTVALAANAVTADKIDSDQIETRHLTINSVGIDQLIAESATKMRIASVSAGAGTISSFDVKSDAVVVQIFLDISLTQADTTVRNLILDIKFNGSLIKSVNWSYYLTGAAGAAGGGNSTWLLKGPFVAFAVITGQSGNTGDITVSRGSDSGDSGTISGTMIAFDLRR